MTEILKAIITAVCLCAMTGGVIWMALKASDQAFEGHNVRAAAWAGLAGIIVGAGALLLWFLWR